MTTEFKEYIKELIAVCREATFHYEYSVKAAFSFDPSPSDDAHSSTRACVKMDTVYLWATITVYPPMFNLYEEGNYQECAEDIMHELCHLFIEPIAKLFMWDACSSQADYYKDAIERQTERMSKALSALMPENWYTPEVLLKHAA